MIRFEFVAWDLVLIIVDGFVKSRHSRENGNPGNSNHLKTLDSCLRRNDKNFFFRLFTRPSKVKNLRSITHNL